MPHQPPEQNGARTVVPAIRMTGIDRRFGAVVANHGASLEVEAGEIHALVGENGAGKSTLMRILAGVITPDAGSVEVYGRDVTGWSAGDAIAAGVGMVHQHFMLVPPLTVAENVVLGVEPHNGWLLDRDQAELEVGVLADRSGLRVPVRDAVSTLSVGEAQRVEILKVLYRGARLLVLDEPTAVLSPPEVDELWAVLRRLRDEGGTVVLITHRLDEVMAISDRVTVMRGGTTVDRLVTSESTASGIARAMVGREVVLADPSVAAVLGTTEEVAGGGRGAPPNSNIAPDITSPATITPHTGPDRPEATIAPVTRPALELRNISVASPRAASAVRNLSLTIAPGEIVGIAGVEGNGQTLLVDAIAGLAPVTGGVILLNRRDVSQATVRQRANAGLSHIPEDRHRRGLILDFTVADNLAFGLHHKLAGRGGALDRQQILAIARRRIEEFDIRPAEPMLPARALSGGNQQKIVIAREMGRDYSVLLAAQPTRGVDVGAIEFIHARLRAARATGKAILLVSADLSEILALSDRIGVLLGGRLVCMLPAAAATAEVLGQHMTGAARGRG